MVKRLNRYVILGLQSIANNLNFALTPLSRVQEANVSFELDGDSIEYLRHDNPRLSELQSSYSEVNDSITDPTVWKENIINSDQLRYFRGENAYVWQSRAGNSGINYALSYYYLLANDTLNLLNRLSEDNLFGVHTYEIGGRPVSRDLLDSVLEILFLERLIEISKLSNFNVLDIGAGYGRLAHRMVTAMPNLGRYYCTDAVPFSTFLSEFYLQYREVNNKAKVIPLTDIDNLRDKNIDIAINIHSFSECSLSAIKWWCDFISSIGIRYLMIAPNPGRHGGKRLLTTPGEDDFSQIIKEAGYHSITMEPKFLDPSVQTGGIFPTHYHLFELS